MLFFSEVGKWVKWPIKSELIPVSLAWTDWEYFYTTLDGMLVYRRVSLNIKFAGTHLYTWVERGTVSVKWLAQGHNTMSTGRARNQTPQTSALTMYGFSKGLPACDAASVDKIHVTKLYQTDSKFTEK